MALRSTPVPVHFLLRDPAWRIVIERLRRATANWEAQSISSWPALVGAVAARPTSYSVIEATVEDAAIWLPRISRIVRLGSGHRAAIVGSPNLKPWEAGFCEIGAVFCGFSLADAPRIGRFLERFAQAVPAPALPIREAIIASLPWAGAAVENATVE